MPPEAQENGPTAPNAVEFPLSFAQQRLWFLDQLDPGSGAYNIPIALRMFGLLDVAALEKSLNEILRRHDSLRTRFPARSGRPVQVIAGELLLPIPEIDLIGLPPSQRENEALRLAAEEAAAPFDLAGGPLVRARRLVVGETEQVLLLTMHHIVSDGWSTGVLLGELAALYDAFRHGRGSPLPELPVQYADYALWQRDSAREEVLERELSYWKSRLAGTPTPLDLPTDRPRPAVASGRGAVESVRFQKPLLDALKTLSRREGATLFMTVLAAFQTLLSRLTGQDDVWIGTPIAGRTQVETEALIGFFVNTLVLRGDLSGDPTFLELLRRVREDALGAYAHQELPFEKLVEDLQPARNLSMTPLFQVMFGLQGPGKTIEIPGLKMSGFGVPRKFAHFDLSCSVTERSDGLSCLIEYRTDLFDVETIRSLLAHFEVLLEGIVADPSTRLSRLPLLTADERRRSIVDWNATETEYPKDRTVQRLFEEQTARTPNAVAMDWDGVRVTYGELNRRANRVARHLREHGVGPDVLVGIYGERSSEMIVALLAILKAGGAYLPLDPAYPPERLRFLLEDSGALLVLAYGEAASDAPALPVRTVALDGAGDAIGPECESDFESGVTASNLAYVIYTSGSTGKPKGVEIEHRSIVNYAACIANLFDLRTTDRVLQFASLSFDAAAEEIFPTLARGGTLVLRTEDMIETVSTFLDKCREWGVTVLDLPTSYWHELVAVASEERLKIPESVRLMVVGGEQALPERFQQWRKLSGYDVRFLNGYGPTETTVAATFWEAGVSTQTSLAQTVPIGRPIANVRTYVLDAASEPVPIGFVGQLHVGGVGVARGYRNRPDLTRTRFVPDPFAQRGGRLYRTGDLARYRHNGDLEYLGRADGQVKIRGFRVELGEIEAALSEISGVREAVVRAREDLPGESRLVAYVVADPNAPVSVSELRRVLIGRLPAYMVPAAFVSLEKMPRTPTGKVDPAALPSPDATRPELDSRYQEPRSPAEETLTGIWRTVLRLDRIGVHDNFFELGGHSLLATQVISRARDAFHVEVPLRDLFLSPTVAGLALTISQRRAERVAPADMERILSELEDSSRRGGS
jgi:amino acid adenylation domain-containing protein